MMATFNGAGDSSLLAGSSPAILKGIKRRNRTKNSRISPLLFRKTPVNVKSMNSPSPLFLAFPSLVGLSNLLKDPTAENIALAKELTEKLIAQSAGESPAPELSDSEKKERGEKIAEAFGLCRHPGASDRYSTTWGSKSSIGVYEVAKRLVEKGK